MLQHVSKLLFKVGLHSIICIYHILLIHSSVDGHLNCLTILNNTAVNIGVQISFQKPALDSFQHIPRSGIAELYDNSMFNFCENYHAVFHAGYAI